MTRPATENVYIERQDYPFCPGCGHGLILNALGSALAKLNLPPKDVAIVTDIGCVGLSDAQLKVHSFHGLHGRSVAYASGLKLAQADLHVIVLMGDGGTGIGAGHILAAARRNMDISVLVFNNFNFGMTGGEHSATTFNTAMTTTTPTGNPEMPFDIAATVTANGASFVARKPSTDRDLFDVVAQAIATPGFSLVDIWELCTAYFVPANQFTGRMFREYAERSGMQMDILTDKRRATLGAYMQQLIETAPPRAQSIPLPISFRHSLKTRRGLITAGSAGGKVKSAVGLLARAAIMSGLAVNQKDDYPVTIKSGHSVSTLILDPQPILYNGVAQPDAVLLLTAAGLQRIGAQLASWPQDVQVYAETSLTLPPTKARVKRFDSRNLSRELGKENIALAVVASVLLEQAYFPLKALKTVIVKRMKVEYREQALAAVESVAEQSIFEQ